MGIPNATPNKEKKVEAEGCLNITSIICPNLRASLCIVICIEAEGCLNVTASARLIIICRLGICVRYMSICTQRVERSWVKRNQHCDVITTGHQLCRAFSIIIMIIGTS
jgi:hypothetical protein